MKTFYSLFVTALLLVAGAKLQAQPSPDDWANLKKFQQANSELVAPAADEQRVVFMGNSITQGWIGSCPEFFNGRSYINRGISGQTTPQMLIRFRQDVVALQPKVVVILAGTNDIAGNTGPSTLEMIEDNLASMAEIAHANGIKVALCSVLPVYDYPWRKGLDPSKKIIALNQWIKQYAERKGHTYVDFYTTLADEKEAFIADYTYDGVHPNKAGYEIMQPIVEKALNLLLQSK
jgi:lysophospholipase L1-like esterase